MKIAIQDGSKYIELNTENLEDYKIGKEAIVYFYNDLAIKIYHSFPEKYILNYEDVKEFSKIETNRILLPKNMTFRIGGYNPLFSGYTTNRVHNVKDFNELHNSNRETLIENLKLIKQDVETLTKKHIQIRDMEHEHNILYNGNIYFVDPGSFIKNKSTDLKRKNSYEIDRALRSNIFMLQNNDELLEKEYIKILKEKYGKYKDSLTKFILPLIKDIYYHDCDLSYEYRYSDYLINILEEYGSIYNYKAKLIEDVIEDRNHYIKKEKVKFLKNSIK